MNAKIVSISLILWIMTCPARAAMTQDQAKACLDQANEAFRQANAQTDRRAAGDLYGKAILGYERLIRDGGIHNAGLSYNLANAYLLDDRIGKAIVNYRRAERLDPSNADIRKNLAFARSRRVDQVQTETRQKVLQTLFFWHYDFAIKTRLVLACWFFGLTCLALCARVWLGRRPGLAPVVCAGLVLTVAFVASTAVEHRQRSGTVSGVITAQSVEARQGDGPNYPPSFKDPLHEGTEFQLIERRPGWLHIQLTSGTEAWIPDATAEVI